MRSVEMWPILPAIAKYRSALTHYDPVHTDFDPPSVVYMRHTLRSGTVCFPLSFTGVEKSDTIPKIISTSAIRSMKWSKNRKKLILGQFGPHPALAACLENVLITLRRDARPSRRSVMSTPAPVPAAHKKC
jgi:hypothetical protein